MLSDKTKRQNYDTYGSADGPQGFGGAGGGFGGFGDFGDFGDIFSSFFGGGGFGGGSRRSRATQPMQGDDIQVKVKLSFVEAAFGCKKSINLVRSESCPDCHGTGAKMVLMTLVQNAQAMEQSGKHKTHHLVRW